MILIFGGTCETSTVALYLAEKGFRVLVSTATDIPLDAGSHHMVLRRRGRLNEKEMISLVQEKNIKCIVDVTHPYAEVVTSTAKRAAIKKGIPYFSWVRPSSIKDDDDVLWGRDHDEAASIAFSIGKPVLLTIGSQNVKPYFIESTKRGVHLFARVLSENASIEACKSLGMKDDKIISGRGPFTVKENQECIKRFSIGVLVTKDTGDAGGFNEKIKAAKLEGCKVVVVRRPDKSSSSGFTSMDDFLYSICLKLKND